MRTRRFTALVALLALCLLAAPAWALKPFTADYTAHYMGMQASGRMTLAPEGGNRWRYTLSVRNAQAGTRPGRRLAMANTTGNCMSQAVLTVKSVMPSAANRS